MAPCEINRTPARFCGKGRQSLHIIIIHVMRNRKMLICNVRLDHKLFSINYGIYMCLCSCVHGCMDVEQNVMLIATYSTSTVHDLSPGLYHIIIHALKL